ncbi:hypothetical protein [Aquabacterium sp. OR-4]|uniref:hypothetical protein n=1 Tax=Aquabacterium sp. OR-4 TaxID=2978127 RepID=UPI0021B3ABDC|nr:hypothetical protein [Aquabacterium sp. OR-4]MDT7835144.1 hypothetical protein [Aquabacterium sp. OR-4]
MHIVAIAWMFVVVLMTAAEATSTQGSLLGAFITFVLYGLLPLGLVLYILGTPARKAARRQAEAAETEAAMAEQAAGAPARPATAHSGPPRDAGGHAPGDGRAPEREKA